MLLLFLAVLLHHCAPVRFAMVTSTLAPSPSHIPKAAHGHRTTPLHLRHARPPELPGSSGRSNFTKHHRQGHHSHPSSTSPPGCEGLLCSDPLTTTPFGSPCGCVYPIKVIIDIRVAPFVLFMHTPELEIEVAAGVFLKQSQVKIMAAKPSIQDQQKTRVTVYLVPLGERFDKLTALLIYDRFWQKKIRIDSSIFGNYDVIYVHYPGLPASPSLPDAPGDNGPSASHNYSDPLLAYVPTNKAQKLSVGIIIVVTLSSFALILACIGIIFFILRWRRLSRHSGCASSTITAPTTKQSGMRSMLSTSMTSTPSVSISTVATCPPPSVKTFLLPELERATNSFDSKRLIGEGGFGRVYHGIMEDGAEVAVKLLTREDRGKDHEFIAEVEMLSRLHHRNLVRLIGICVDRKKKCLVYELVRNGSVESHLHGVDKGKGLLNWETRMKIALGAARGLAYLHEDSNPHVIHRDFKASNILLEEDFTPKVTDFGLAREASEGMHHISTRVMGTFGYVAPEYAMTGHLLIKSDVYSYGVVLLELLSGRKPVYISENRGPENLVTWARPLLGSQEGLEKLIDPLLCGSYNFDDVAKVASIASVCVHIEPSHRPFMGEVVQALKLIYKDIDETDNESSLKGSSFGLEHGYTNDLFPPSNWWNGASPCLDYRNDSPFITMEYSSGRISQARSPYTALSLDGRAEMRPSPHFRSGPLRMKKFAAFYRLRGCVSEHGHLPRRASADHC